MGDNQVTTRQESGPSNPMVTQTLDQLLGQLQGQISAGPPTDIGPGYNTQMGWNGALNAANNPQFAAGIGQAQNYANNLIANGGLTGGQRNDMNAMRGLQGQFAQLGQNGGLSGDMRGAMSQMSGLGESWRRLGAQNMQPGIMERNLMGVARGDMLRGGNPYFEENLGNALNDAGAGVNAAIGSSGRFGSGAHVGQLGQTLGQLSTSARSQQYETERDRQMQALQGIGGEQQMRTGNQMAALTGRGNVASNVFGMGQQGRDNQMAAFAGQGNAASQAFGMGQQGNANVTRGGNDLQSLFQASLLPSQIQGAVGREQDAFRDRRNNNSSDWLARLSSIFGGTAPFGGTTQTQTEPGTPWWQTLLGGALGIGGAFL
jgi:hypothetical protein